MKLSFFGGARTVTGANYLLENEEGVRVLIDCGLHQGSHYCEKHNFEAFSYDPTSIEAVFITHAHIDHIGRLPRLVKAGFRGKIFSTPPTKDFAEFLLLDSEKILANEAEAQGKEPLYTPEDVTLTTSLWVEVPYYQRIQLRGFEVEFYNAGHIVGSSSVVVTATKEQKRIVFSGDLGNPSTPFIKPVDKISEADYVVMESTYGGRIHEDKQIRKDILEDIIEETMRVGGVLIVPAFALERTQELLFELNELVENGRIPRVPIFIDSPLAIHLTALYKKYLRDPTYFNEKAMALLRGGDAIFDFPGLRLTLTTAQSKEINEVPPPKIILAGSGMSNGGRILHHERRYLSNPNNTLLIIGYQASGSLGRQILDGAKKVKIMGEEITVRARVKAIGGYSAHADQPSLISWLRPMRLSLKRVFLVQGEEDQMKLLLEKVEDQLAVPVEIPSPNEEMIL